VNQRYDQIGIFHVMPGWRAQFLVLIQLDIFVIRYPALGEIKSQQISQRGRLAISADHDVHEDPQNWGAIPSPGNLTLKTPGASSDC
jgi:hypothetical protein